MTVSKPRGPAPKPTDKRRRTNKPESYGLAEPTDGGIAAQQPSDLGFEAHELVESLWQALGQSIEGKFYSHADWQRARMELWYANRLIRTRGRISSQGWAVLQTGLSDLLISPADKRRIGIELAKAADDPDEDAAILQIAKYQDAIGSTS